MRDVGGWSCLLIAQESNEAQADYTYDVTVFEQTSLAFSARPYKEMIVGNQVDFLFLIFLSTTKNKNIFKFFEIL